MVIDRLKESCQKNKKAIRILISGIVLSKAPPCLIRSIPVGLLTFVSKKSDNYGQKNKSRQARCGAGW
jgi:hypothetical protein